MPFISQAQRAYFHATADRGEIPKSTVKEFEEKTPKGKKLPYKVKKAEEEQAYWQAYNLAALLKEASPHPQEFLDALIAAGLIKESGIFQALGKRLHTAGTRELELTRQVSRSLKREEALAKRFGRKGPITRREQRRGQVFEQVFGMA